MCNQAEDAGNCDNYVIKYTYDAKERHCKAYYYGGCGGNENRFDSQEDCESVCVGRRPPPRTDTQGNFHKKYTNSEIFVHYEISSCK